MRAAAESMAGRGETMMAGLQKSNLARGFLRMLGPALALTVGGAAHAVTLVQTSDPGFYNNSIGAVLNDTNGGEGGPFPVSNDSTVHFPTAPDLSAAGAALGNWLIDPLHLNANWSHLANIPNSWAVGTEVAVIYEFDTLGATNVHASFGVDNGIFIWLDGTYIDGNRAGGGASLGEYQYSLGDLTAGTHFLQLLLEDHGLANGYAVQITADTFIPGPPPSMPEPATLAALGAGLLGLCMARRRKRG
jgi:hypothetical protein